MLLDGSINKNNTIKNECFFEFYAEFSNLKFENRMMQKLLKFCFYVEVLFLCFFKEKFYKGYFLFEFLFLKITEQKNEILIFF
ncbi:hypothetical protein RT99_11695 [Flavobacterium sp. MEB061]|nr:hypothetical protein RT99_11695 [Flavobacterium sp. MEB061]